MAPEILDSPISVISARQGDGIARLLEEKDGKEIERPRCSEARVANELPRLLESTTLRKELSTRVSSVRQRCSVEQVLQIVGCAFSGREGKRA
jgi:hypothetical protein